MLASTVKFDGDTATIKINKYKFKCADTWTLYDFFYLYIWRRLGINLHQTKTNIIIDANTKQNDQRNPWFIYSYRSGSAVGERAFRVQWRDSLDRKNHWMPAYGLAKQQDKELMICIFWKKCGFWRRAW